VLGGARAAVALVELGAGLNAAPRSSGGTGSSCPLASVNALACRPARETAPSAS
jgi:hypothetical protein